MMKDAVIKKIVNVQFIYSYTSGYFFKVFKTRFFFGRFLFLDLCKICLSNSSKILQNLFYSHTCQFVHPIASLTLTSI